MTNSTSTATMITCPHCGAQTSDATGFCDECGVELTTQAIKPVTAAQLMASGTLNMDDKPVCPFCGHVLRSHNTRHCPNCGKKLGLAPVKTPSSDIPSVLQIGKLVADRYGLEDILGEGGMGRVWKAFDRHLNKYVVIKTVLTPDDHLRHALQKEAEVLINIRHPNIVAVIDFFTVESELCYVMEFVSGPSWADEIEEAGTRKLVLPMSAEEALTRIKGLLPAFKYLHGLKPPIIYCDFKPANVKSMVLANGDRIEVLLDFGTAYLYDPKVPPKPARGTPGYHSPNAAHPDWRDDYFTIGRTIAELIGMAEVHSEQYRYDLTPADHFPWTQYDDSLRYFVEWLVAPKREDRPANVDDILEQLDGVLGFVKGQQPNKAAYLKQREKVNLTAITSYKTTGTTQVSGTVKIDLPEVAHTNPAATILLSAQEAYQQRNMTRALLLANQAINNNGGAAAYLLRSLIHSQDGDLDKAAKDLHQAQMMFDPQLRWETLLAQGQLLESQGQLDQAADCFRGMMALKPGDYRGRLLLADLYRRTGNNPQAITEYRAIIQAKPNVGSAYLGASRTYLANNQLDFAINILETVSSRNASYNEVLMDLIDLYNQKATQGDANSLEQAARMIGVLHENGVESRQFYHLIGEFYFTACKLARRLGAVPKITWPDGKTYRSLTELSHANERAWRDYLVRDEQANHEDVILNRIMDARTWELV